MKCSITIYGRETCHAHAELTPDDAAMKYYGLEMRRWHETRNIRLPSMLASRTNVRVLSFNEGLINAGYNALLLNVLREIFKYYYNKLFQNISLPRNCHY